MSYPRLYKQYTYQRDSQRRFHNLSEAIQCHFQRHETPTTGSGLFPKRHGCVIYLDNVGIGKRRIQNMHLMPQRQRVDDKIFRARADLHQTGKALKGTVMMILKDDTHKFVVQGLCLSTSRSTAKSLTVSNRLASIRNSSSVSM